MMCGPPTGRLGGESNPVQVKAGFRRPCAPHFRCVYRAAGPTDLTVTESLALTRSVSLRLPGRQITEPATRLTNGVDRVDANAIRMAPAVERLEARRDRFITPLID